MCLRFRAFVRANRGVRDAHRITHSTGHGATCCASAGDDACAHCCAGARDAHTNGCASATGSVASADRCVIADDANYPTSHFCH
jgi:hypothetical protein